MLDIHLRSRNTVAAIVDVGIGGASVAICAVGSQGAEFRATGSSKLSLESVTEAQAKERIAQHVAEAAAEAAKGYSGVAPIVEAYVIVHAPWTTIRTTEQKTSFTNETKIHASTIAQLASEALGSLKVERSRMLEGNVVRVELNGYPTAQPEGKLARELTVAVLASECDPALKEAIGAAVMRAFPVAKLLWRSSARALTTFARASDVLDHHFTIVDMGPEVTQLLSVRGALMTEKTVAEGTRSILARVAPGKQPEEALSALRVLERDAASSEAMESLQKQCALAEQDMVKSFAEAIGTLAATARVSNSLLLLCHPDLEPWLSRFFTRIDFAQFTSTTLPFTVYTPRDISTGVAFGGASELLVDAALFNTEAHAAA